MVGIGGGVSVSGPALSIGEYGKRLAEQRPGVGAVERLGEPEALSVATTHLAQQIQLTKGLDTLGDHVDAESVTEGDDDLDELGRAWIDVELADERAIDLQRLHR
jgi:hypothetical protein